MLLARLDKALALAFEGELLMSKLTKVSEIVMMKKLISIIFIFNINLAQPKEYFKDKSNGIIAINTIHVVTDTTLVELINKNEYGLNVNYNLELGHSLFNTIEKSLSKRVKANFSHVLNSVGLKNQANTYFLDYQERNKKLFVPITKNYEKLNQEENLYLGILDPLADTIYDPSNPSFGMHKKYQKNVIAKDFLSINELNLEEDEAILILLTTGVKVPTKTTVKGAVVSSVLTLGMLSAAKVSVTNMNLILLSNEGEILWAGKVLRHGTFGSNWKQTILFNKTLKGFPVKKTSNRNKASSKK